MTPNGNRRCGPRIYCLVRELIVGARPDWRNALTQPNESLRYVNLSEMMALFQSDLREGRLVEGIEILIGVCVVVAIVLVVVVVVRFVRRRSVIVAAVKHEFQLIDARQVYQTSMSSRHRYPRNG